MLTPDLAGLLALCPPPADPLNASGDFESIEQQVGLALPSEFKALVAAYGEGTFADFFNVLHPFTEGESCLASCARRLLDGDRVLASEFPEDVSHALHPAPGGLFPWGQTRNGNIVYWATSGPPDSWTVVVGEARGLKRLALGVGTVAFLRGWLAGELDIPLFPSEKPEVRFDPANPLGYVDIYFRHESFPFKERLDELLELLPGAQVLGKNLRKDYSQVALRAADNRTRFTYSDNAAHGARFNVLFPAEREAATREQMLALCGALGWTVWRVADQNGNAMWEELKGA